MGTVREIDLSESTYGQPIGISDNSSPGQLIHTATDDDEDYDKIQLYAVNIGAADRILTIEWGSNFNSKLCKVLIPPSVGYVLVIPLLRIAGGLALSAWADVADEVNVQGWVLRHANMGQPSFQDRTDG